MVPAPSYPLALTANKAVGQKRALGTSAFHGGSSLAQPRNIGKV